MAGVPFYVAQALSKIDLGGVKAVALDGTASKRDHNYATVFIDLDRKRKPVIFVIPAKARAVWSCFAASCVSMAAITTISPKWSATCRQPSWPPSPWTRSERSRLRSVNLSKATRRAVLKAADGGRLTKKQQQALTELETGGFASGHRLTVQGDAALDEGHLCTATQWRVTNFTRHALQCIALDTKTLVLF
ncbi:hypothetical protein DFAR_3460029 [Desulfarculales bacterium]